MSKYLPFLLMLFFFAIMMLQTKISILKKLFFHPLTTAIPGLLMLYFAFADREHRWIYIFFVLLAIGLTIKRLGEGGQNNQF